MEGSDKSPISVRLQELVATHGKHWGAIAEIMEKEGIRDKEGNPLSSNALRKRYKKLSGTYLRSEMEEPVSTQERGTSDFDRMQEHRMDSALKQFGRGGLVPAGSVDDAIAGLVTLNTQLLAQIKESKSLMQRLEKRLEQQELKISHTGIDTGEQPVTSRDLLELLKEITLKREEQMQFIEEKKEYYPSREEIHELIEESVQQKVEIELKAMLAAESSFSRQLALLVDERLKTLFSGGEPVPQTAHAGPGRGKRGKTHKKFSASLEESLFERVKSLPGQFSGHLANALEAYLSVVEKNKPA